MQKISTFGDFGAALRRIAATFPADAGVDGQHVIVTNTPSILFTVYAPVINALGGQPVPSAISVLASSLYPVEMERIDTQTVVIRPAGGFMLRPGTAPPGSRLPPISPLRIIQSSEWLARRGDEPFPAGPFPYGGIVVEVLELTDDARPAAVAYRFPRPLESPLWRWVCWREGGFVEFRPPSIGERVRLQSLIE
jgi:hypothetical protein